MANDSTNGTEPGSDPPHFSAKGFAIWFARRFRDHLVSIIIGAIVGFGAGIIFGEEQSQRLVQNTFGAHCATDVFNSAKRDGLSLTFEPPAIEHMAICGPGKFRGKSARNILQSYVRTYQPNCLSLQDRNDGYAIGVAESDEVIAHDAGEGATFFTCRCKQDQAEVMFKYVPELCGTRTPDPGEAL